MAGEKRYWVSFQLNGDLGGFEYHGPWWISGWGGQNMDEPCVCLAAIAGSEAAVKKLVRESFDEPPVIREWRFINERADDWAPFCDRFGKQDWMQWPITAQEALNRRANGG